MAQIIDGMMHLENVGAYWPSLPDEVIEHYDRTGIDKGVVMATWMPSTESNDITREACQRHPDRFIPFGHVRPIDDWETELRRITQEFGWTGLKLHKGELNFGTDDLEDVARRIVGRAAELGIRVVKIHLEDYAAVDALTREFPQVIWILPHLGCYHHAEVGLVKYCALARERDNVYLDTSAVSRYYDMDLAIQWAGTDNVTFASDGFLYSPLVEKAKIDSLTLPTPHRVPPLTTEQYAQIMGGNMAKILGIEP